jgi:hypothetical protein
MVQFSICRPAGRSLCPLEPKSIRFMPTPPVALHTFWLCHPETRATARRAFFIVNFFCEENVNFQKGY